MTHQINKVLYILAVIFLEPMPDQRIMTKSVKHRTHRKTSKTKKYPEKSQNQLTVPQLQHLAPLKMS